MKSVSDPRYGARPHGACCDAVPLCADAVAGMGLSDFQRAVANGIATVVAALPEDCQRSSLSTAIEGDECKCEIGLMPANPESAAIKIVIDPDRYVHIFAAERAAFGLPDDVWDKRASDVPEFAKAVVSAIVAGHLTEQTWYRGETEVAVRHELLVGSQEVCITRVSVLKRIALFWKRPRIVQHAYAPFAS